MDHTFVLLVIKYGVQNSLYPVFRCLGSEESERNKGSYVQAGYYNSTLGSSVVLIIKVTLLLLLGFNKGAQQAKGQKGIAEEPKPETPKPRNEPLNPKPWNP